MSGFLQDLRYAGRMLFKSPGISVMAVTALALGIGVTATMFSIVYAAMLRGLPEEGGDRVMFVLPTLRGSERTSASIHEYVDWRDQQSSFESLAAYYTGTINARWTDRPERFDGAFITANGFSPLGVQPVLGRLFRDEEMLPGAPLRVIISYHLWQDRFGGSRDAIGQVLKVNGESAEVVGVMPEGFLFPEQQDLWVPLRTDALELPRGEGPGLQVYGRLRKGVSLKQARAEFKGIAARLASAYPDTEKERGVEIGPFTDIVVGPEGRATLLAMLGAVSLVLLIACANVANLLLARAAVRVKEVGIRTALGASRWRVLSQLVSESLALSLVGGAIGAGLAWVGVALFNRAIAPTDPPYYLVFAVDTPILVFVLATSVIAAVVAGGIPAFQASRMDVNSVLKDESRGSSGLRVGRLSKVLVIGEIAMSMGLLVASGLMAKSVTTLRDYDFGVDQDEVFTARVALFDAAFPDVEKRRLFFDELSRRLAEIPAATSVALSNTLPAQGSPSRPVAIEGKSYAEDRDYPEVRYALASPDFFRTVGSRIVVGRDFELSDDADAVPVAIVNESFAKRFFPDGSPLGRRIRPGISTSTEPWRTVVGVVPDLWMQGIQNSTQRPDGYYIPLAQSDAHFMSIVARGPADPMSLTEAVRDAVASVDADTPIYFVNTLAARLFENTWIYNVFGVLFMVFGAVALFLASVGLYAVMAFSVSRRKSEVGIRMALGARARQVRGMILRQGMVQVVTGIVIGLGLAVVVARAMTLVIFQARADDPMMFVLVAGVLVVTGAVASLVPAGRATRVDPAVALHSD